MPGELVLLLAVISSIKLMMNRVYRYEYEFRRIPCSIKLGLEKETI